MALEKTSWIEHLKGRKAFLVCLLLSIAFWLLIKLSKDYSTLLTFNVKYTTLADTTWIIQEDFKPVSFRVEGHGYGLMGLYFGANDLSEINLWQTKSSSKAGWRQAYLSPAKLKSVIETQLPEGFNLKSGLEDSVIVYYSPIRRRRLPVSLSKTPEVVKGSMLVSYSFNPDSIYVEAPLSILDTIKEVKVWNEELAVLSSSVSENFELYPEHDMIKIAQENIEFQAEVSVMANKTFDLPIGLIFNKGNYQLLPESAKLTVFGPASKLNKWAKSDFSLIVTMDTARTYLPIELISDVPELTRYDIKPNFVEYLKIMDK